MSADAVSGCVSLVPNLVPLAASVLAITLAYLNLERFRYGITVGKLAAEALDRIDQFCGSRDSSVVRATRDYEELQKLASLSPDFSATLVSLDDRQTNSSGKSISYIICRSVFNSNIDIIPCCISALFSSFVLALGSAHAVGLCYLSDCAYLSLLFGDGYIAAPYWTLVGGGLLPIVFVSLGFCIIRSCRRKQSKLEDNIYRIAKALQEQAQNAKVNTIGHGLD